MPKIDQVPRSCRRNYTGDRTSKCARRQVYPRFRKIICEDSRNQTRTWMFLTAEGSGSVAFPSVAAERDDFQSCENRNSLLWWVAFWQPAGEAAQANMSCSFFASQPMCVRRWNSAGVSSSPGSTRLRPSLAWPQDTSPQRQARPVVVYPRSRGHLAPIRLWN